MVARLVATVGEGPVAADHVLLLGWRLVQSSCDGLTPVLNSQVVPAGPIQQGFLHTASSMSQSSVVPGGPIQHGLLCVAGSMPQSSVVPVGPIQQGFLHTAGPKSSVCVQECIVLALQSVWQFVAVAADPVWQFIVSVCAVVDESLDLLAVRIAEGVAEHHVFVSGVVLHHLEGAATDGAVVVIVVVVATV